MKWERKKVSEVCELAYGKSLIADSRIPGDYPVYGSAGEVGTHTNYLIEGPGIIIGRKGSVGTVYYEKRNFFPIDTTYYVIPKEGNDLRFLYYKFQTLGLNKLNSDAAVPGLNRNVAYEQSSFYPPLPIQRKIASILSAYDDLIENNLKRIKLLEEKAFLRYKQIVREEKFSQKAFNEVADYINGYPFKPEDWKNEGLPIIKIKELKAGVQNDTPRNDGENIPEKYFIENKDILFAWSASIGAYLWCSGKSILNQHIFKVKPFDKDFHNWLYFSLLEKIPDFINLSNGATMQHIKKSALGMVYLPVPPKKIYQEFQKETEPILNLVVNLNQQNTKLREARDILLPKLMNGEIEV
ncbi:MAG: restriction endonuclease subunit S [Bacteroidales bacterium]|jgi:type I restriction enzyme S subunit|nr:restriction endonuclease subunit S [Bacteroidales bacterium]